MPISDRSPPNGPVPLGLRDPGLQPGQAELSDGVDGDGAGVPLSVEVDNPLIQRMINGHEVMVLDSSTVGDPLLRRLMEESGSRLRSSPRSLPQASSSE